MPSDQDLHCSLLNSRMIKWIAAFFGYYFFRFPGAIFGFFVGSVLEKVVNGSGSNFQTFTQRADPVQFQINLIAFAAIVIKADGQVKAQELQFVRNFFITIIVCINCMYFLFMN